MEIGPGAGASHLAYQQVSRRDSVSKPRVARNELPWVCGGTIDTTLKGLRFKYCNSLKKSSHDPFSFDTCYEICKFRLPTLFVIAFLIAAFFSLVLSLHAAETTNESQLIQILQSDASLQKKDAACVQLKRIGSDRCIPALSTLLTDEQLSHSARYVLESMQSSNASAALIDALPKTTESIQAGIIYSLGVRREPLAVPALGKVLSSEGKTPSDTNVIPSAIAALGEIATPAAVELLQKQAPHFSGNIHLRISDALLCCASHALAVGERSRAAALFDNIYASETNEFIRVNAYSGTLRASPSPGSLYSEALTGPPGAKQAAALRCLNQANFPDAGRTFAALLPKTPPLVQVPLIEGLKQRGDVIAAAKIAMVARGGHPVVIPTALAALGELGDDSVVPLLAVGAAFGTDEEKVSARQALTQLHRGEPTKAILAQFAKSTPEINAELARALGQRGDPVAVPKLLKLAQEEFDPTRKAALQALTLLAREQDLGALVELVAHSLKEASPDAVEALTEAVVRMKERNRSIDVTPLLTAMESSTNAPSLRIALLPVCSILTDPKTRLALRKAVADPSSEIRFVGIRALCDTRDIELLPDVIKIAVTAPEENLRVLATGACVRLVTQDEGAKLPPEARLAPLKTVLEAKPSLAQKRMLLAGLAEIPAAEALALSAPLVSENEVQTEAAQAVLKIAPTLRDTNAAITALEKLTTTTKDEATRQRAETILKQIRNR